MIRSDPMIIRSTTILCLRKDRHVAMGSDGQVTHGTTIMKQNAKKLRRMYNDTVLAGFAGATADAFTPLLLHLALEFLKQREVVGWIIRLSWGGRLAPQPTPSPWLRTSRASWPS